MGLSGHGRASPADYYLLPTTYYLLFTKHRPDCFRQLALVEWLGKRGVGAEKLRHLQHVGAGEARRAAGHGDERQMGELVLDGADQLQAVDLWHEHVGN